MLALPIFPGPCGPSIVGTDELNFRVRDGNGWTLALISTYFTFSEKKVSKEKFLRLFSPYRLSNSKYYIRFCSIVKNHFINGDPYGNRTHVCGVRGRRLNRLTNGPCGAPSGIRTRDPLIKSQLLYQLS